MYRCCNGERCHNNEWCHGGEQCHVEEWCCIRSGIGTASSAGTAKGARTSARSMTCAGLVIIIAASGLAKLSEMGVGAWPSSLACSGLGLAFMGQSSVEPELSLVGHGSGEKEALGGSRDSSPPHMPLVLMVLPDQVSSMAHPQREVHAHQIQWFLLWGWSQQCQLVNDHLRVVWHRSHSLHGLPCWGTP